MKRSTRLTAKTELKRTTALTRVPFARSALHAGSAARKPTASRSGSAIPSKVRTALKLRSGGLCEIEAPGCTEVATDFSHRKKVGAGGRKGAAAVAHHVLSNGLAACRPCHQFCHANPAAANAQGWMLREHQNPLSEPVVYRGTWCLLSDDGSVHPVESTEEEPVPNYVQSVESRLKELNPRLTDDHVRAYTLLVLTCGESCTLQNVHDAWAVGRNATRPTHPDIIPFDQLDPETAKDERFAALIRQVAAEVVSGQVAA